MDTQTILLIVQGAALAALLLVFALKRPNRRPALPAASVKIPTASCKSSGACGKTGSQSRFPSARAPARLTTSSGRRRALPP